MLQVFHRIPNCLAACLVVCACATSPENAEVDAIAVAVNQHGFEPGGVQSATIITSQTAPLAWKIQNSAGDVIRYGDTQVFGQSEAAGETVHTLSVVPPLRRAATYQINIADETTQTIKVHTAPYDDLAQKILNYFYLNRAGLDILEAFAPSPKWARKAGHVSEDVTCYKGPDKTGLEWPGCNYSLDVTGGWYDAGDFGKYAVNGGISVWMLQNAAERLKTRGGMAANGWGDGSAALPEAGNGIPDILDEARWQIEFLLSLQVPEGSELIVAIGQQSVANGNTLDLSPINASGMVHHKVHAEHWPAFPLRPQDDQAERFLFPPSTSGTLNMVAVTAQAARLWRGLDDEFAERCLRAAIKGYEAAKRNPNVHAYTNFDGGGAYGDLDVSDEFAWAATELYATTGDTTYISQLNETPGAGWLLRASNGTLRDVFWADVDLLPFLTALTDKHAFSDADKSEALTAIKRAADRYAADASKDGYGVPYPPDAYGWGSNGAIAARSLVLGHAYDITGDVKYRNTIVAALDYLLGRNPLNQSYIAGFGQNPVKFVHHRYWAAGADLSFPTAAPGALSGGPNASYPVSDSETAFIGNCAPQKCWIDDHNGYSINEVAINWNAALFWLASYLETTSPNSEQSTESTQ